MPSTCMHTAKKKKERKKEKQLTFDTPHSASLPLYISNLRHNEANIFEAAPQRLGTPKKGCSFHFQLKPPSPGCEEEEPTHGTTRAHVENKHTQALLARWKLG